jgi:hypothetical protein
MPCVMRLSLVWWKLPSFLRHVGKYLAHETASHPRRQQFAQLLHLLPKSSK